mgnify:CR=1 FL=1
MKESVNFVFGSFLDIQIEEKDGAFKCFSELENVPLFDMTDNTYHFFAHELFDENFEGICDEFDYFSVLTKLTDLLYTKD